MKFSAEHIAAALALLALGYIVGQRRAKATANAGGAVVPAQTNSQADWWTYPGSWGM